jgi:hypothetical protein
LLNHFYEGAVLEVELDGVIQTVPFEEFHELAGESMD